MHRKTLYILNFTPKVAGSLLDFGNILEAIARPWERAFGGIRDRKRRADFERGEKGLNVMLTLVRKRVIIFEV